MVNGTGPASPTHAGRMLIFDGDCGFCTSAANFCRRRLPTDVRVVPWQRVGDPAAVGLTPQTIREAAWWIDSDGRPRRGHRALAESARAFGGAWALLGGLMRIPPFDWLGAHAYTILARNRYRLPGGTPACQVPPLK